MNSGVSTTLKMRNPHVQFDSNTSLPLNKHPEDKGISSYKVLLRESTAGSSGVVPAASAGEPAAKIRADCMKTRTISRRRKRRQKDLKNPHQEPHLPFHPGMQLLLRPGPSLPLWLGAHRTHRITKPPVRDTIQASKKLSTACTPTGLPGLHYAFLSTRDSVRTCSLVRSSMQYVAASCLSYTAAYSYT